MEYEIKIKVKKTVEKKVNGKWGKVGQAPLKKEDMEEAYRTIKPEDFAGKSPVQLRQFPHGQGRIPIHL